MVVQPTIDASVAFEKPNHPTKREKAKDVRIVALEAKLRQKDAIIVELLEEHFELRNTLGTKKPFDFGIKRKISGGLGDWSPMR